MSPPVVSAFREIPRLGNTVVAIGAFDGVHRGHQYLLLQARERAHSHGDAFVVITFAPSPQLVLRPALRRFELTPAPLKIALLMALDPDLIVVLPFTKDLASTSADDFMDALEERLDLREMWMGEDFAFGHRRSGNVPYLIARGQTSGFSVHVIPRAPWGDIPVSSTRIRQALADGEVDLAAELLGRSYRLSGTLRVDATGTFGDPSGGHGMPNAERGPVAFWVADTQAIPAHGRYTVTVSPAQPAEGTEIGGVLVVPLVPEEADRASRLDLFVPDQGAELWEGQDAWVAVLGRIPAP